VWLPGFTMGYSAAFDDCLNIPQNRMRSESVLPLPKQFGSLEKLRNPFMMLVCKSRFRRGNFCCETKSKRDSHLGVPHLHPDSQMTLGRQIFSEVEFLEGPKGS
jgi:hypothetical protein